MALVTLAVVGRDNEPLYIRDFVTATSQNQGIPSTSMSNDDNDDDDGEASASTHFTNNDDEDEIEEEDPFGFFEYQSKKLNESCSMTQQVRYK